MKQRLLKILNFPGMILLALLGLTLQSTLFNHPSLAFFQPDLLLFFILWVSIKREFIEGGILTLLFAYLVEIHSSAPQGFYFCTYMGIYLLARLLSQQFQITSRTNLAVVGILFSLIMRMTVLMILFFLNRAESVFMHTLQLLAPTVFSHSILIFVVFRILHRFDLWTLKNPESERRQERNFALDEEWV